MKKYLFVSIIFILLLASIMVCKNNGLNFMLAQLNPSFIIQDYVDSTLPVVSDVNVNYRCGTEMATLTARVSDPESDVNPGSVTAIIGSSSFPMISIGDDTYSVGIPFSACPSGNCDIYISATNGVGLTLEHYTHPSWPKFTPLDCSAPVVTGVTFNFNCPTSVLTVSATITDGTNGSGVNLATVLVEDASNNLKGTAIMTAGANNVYTATFNAWNLSDGIYHFHISVSDKSVPVNNKTYTDVLWTFNKLSTCSDAPPVPTGDKISPAISGNVVYNSDTNKAVTTATITDASGIASAIVIFKNYAGEIVSTALMTNSASIYTQIMDVLTYPAGIYYVDVSATDNSTNKNNAIKNVGSFATQYAIDSFTVNPTSAVAGATMGTSLTLTAHMSGASDEVSGEIITFSDDTDPSVVIGEANVGADGIATISFYKIDTSIISNHTLRATHEANPSNNLPYSYLTTVLNITNAPVCSTVADNGTICIYISNIENSAQLSNFTVNGKMIDEFDEAFLTGVVRAGVTTGTPVVLSVDLASTTLCSGEYPLSECSGTYSLADETIIFSDETDSVVLGSAVTNDSGVAILSYYPPTSQNVGKHTLRATYGGSIKKGYRPSYLENYLGESINVCSYANGDTSGDRICVFLGFLNSGSMTSFNISPTSVTAGLNTGSVSPGTLVTFTVALPGHSGETVIFIDNTQEYTLGWVYDYYVRILRPECNSRTNIQAYIDNRESVVLGTAVTNSLGVATFTYRFPYAVAVFSSFYHLSYDYDYSRLMPQNEGAHKIMAVYGGNNDLQPSWRINSLSLSVPGKCVWFPNRLSSEDQCLFDSVNTGVGRGDYFCSAITTKNP